MIGLPSELCLVILLVTVAQGHGTGVGLPNERDTPARSMDESLRRDWGRVPEPGELWDARRPWSISLSPDGSRLAVSVISPLSGGWMEVWKIQPAQSSWRHTPTSVFPDLLSWQMLWHPTRNWLLAVTEPIGLQVVNLDRKASRFLPVAAFAGQVTWLDSSDSVLAVAKVAGERPNELTVLDVITGKKRSFRAPWVRDLGKLTQYCGITSQAASASGDFAVVFAANGKREDIVMYPRSDKKTSWRKAGTISSRLGPSGGVIARPKIVNWLADGRLVYAMLYYGPESTSLQRVELWTAKRDGFDQRKWLDLPGAAPPSYNKIGDAWVTVSASGKRIAFFRDDRLYVFDADELVSHGGLGRSGRKQPP